MVTLNLKLISSFFENPMNPMSCNYLAMVADGQRTWIRSLPEFLGQGGFFLWIILGCGIMSLVVVILRLGWMRREQLLPEALVGALRGASDVETIEFVNTQIEQARQDAPLTGVARTAMESAAIGSKDINTAVEARARSEVMRMQWGLGMLEVIIVIAPLLGLLGTAAGLVDVFEGIGGADKDIGLIALGIGKALSTTIAGLAVAVPSVIAHSAFSTQVERWALEMEMLLQNLTSAIRLSYPGVF